MVEVVKSKRTRYCKYKFTQADDLPDLLSAMALFIAAQKLEPHEVIVTARNVEASIYCNERNVSEEEE